MRQSRALAPFVVGKSADLREALQLLGLHVQAELCQAQPTRRTLKPASERERRRLTDAGPALTLFAPVASQLGITTPVLGALQLLLGVTLYRNPIINPPLDQHGMPIPQDPETGLPMPLDAKGQPILPEWLLPRDPKTGELLPCDHSGNLLDPKKAKAVREKKGKGEEAAPWGTDTEGKEDDSSAGDDDSDEDKSLLENKGMQELGRRGRRGGAGRERSSRSRRERR